MRALYLSLLALVAAFAVLAPAAARAERVRDLGAFQGVRANQLTGYGIVVGLAGTGDDNLEYLTQAMRGISGRMGVQLPPGVSPGLKNAAAVMITADLPAFAKPGQRIDITVSTLGKAKSLRGGALILTPLYGADGQIYAMAQGNLAVGGLGISAKDGSQLTVNVPTVGRIADGASVERAVATGFDSAETLRWNLNEADFLTANRVRDVINARFPGVASVEDGVTLALRLPRGGDARAGAIASIEMLEVKPAETPARVIINSRTGTVVINSAVRLAPADRNLSAHGAYELAPATGAATVTIFASGTEVAIALGARDILQAGGVGCRVVSTPCWELFDTQPADYRTEVIGGSPVRIAVEAGVRQGWERFIGENGGFVGMTGFGASAPAEVLYKHFGITAEAVAAAAKAKLG